MNILPYEQEYVKETAGGRAFTVAASNIWYTLSTT